MPPKYPTSQCPPTGSMFTVGRTMFETDRLPSGWADRLNVMQEVWVPTHFHADVFHRDGVRASKLVVVPEPIDTQFFDPIAAPPLRASRAYGIDVTSSAFKFFSVFKFEYRKGVDVLLAAFAAAFGGHAATEELYILTSSYHSSTDFQAGIDEHLATAFPDGVPPSVASRIKLVDRVPQDELPSVYAAMDAFVLPSRGEGWGRPIVEAMAMELPVIATNWSGPTAFLTPHNSLPLHYDGFRPIPTGAFAGHLMAEPSVTHLTELMAHVAAMPAADRAAVGRQARHDMLAFAPHRVARFVRHQLQRIADEVQRPQPPEVPPPHRPRREL